MADTSSSTDHWVASAVPSSSSSPSTTPVCWMAYGSESAPAPSVAEHMLNAVPHTEPCCSAGQHAPRRPSASSSVSSGSSIVAECLGVARQHCRVASGWARARAKGAKGAEGKRWGRRPATASAFGAANSHRAPSAQGKQVM
eukprot:scaffold85975_cov62-Phaeocystis_antarctica.AAC.5